MCRRWVKSFGFIEEEKKEESKRKKIWRYEDFSEEKIIYIAIRTMIALKYLHSKDVVYMDLKP